MSDPESGLGMLIVAGYLEFAPADRDAYFTECVPVVQAARRAAGCLEFSITADSVDAGKVQVYERWVSEERLLAFRGDGPSGDPQPRILDANVKRYVISSVGEP